MPRPLAVLLAALASAPAPAVEPWADRSLTAPPGLVLWLDAARQPDAFRAHDLPAPRHGGPVGVWYDGSGNRHHVTQRLTASQPRFARADRHAALRFDGKQQFLQLTNLGRAVDEFTLFVVAAPRSNAGFFRGLVSANETGKLDYTSGFTLDLTGFATTRLDHVNVEGKGFGGAVNLLDRAFSFGEFRTFEVVAEPKRVHLAVDGKAARSRPRTPGMLRLDEVTVGARFYSNEPKPSYVQGFLDGDVAEVLLFDRALSAAERENVRGYLSRKHAGLTAALASPEGAPRVVADPPPVQVLVPGFRVRQLPVDLPNVNNVRYRADGKLVALGYDGNVWLLSDTDGDGVEDKADLFWDNKGRLRSPVGMALTPTGYGLGEGLFVASKGKLSLIVDTKGAGKADREIVVASGWKELPHNVDALGVAVARDGTVYFGLGTADFTNAYLVEGGRSRYDLGSERGTVLEVSPDFKTRKIFCTGIRFPVGLAFNRRGDLFATDQEGATWLPDGNPFDELLHLRRGRHYGFPPRHPKHLPGVIDEPSTFDYGPQHQSTCGLAFNDGPVFGPGEWAGDALVAGYSRGKLYRTQLAHTAEGYVARNRLLACLNMLAVDVCVSPKGDLVVAVHSGAPDWGSGPGGRGRLYKISYVGKDLPQPVAAWPAGPREVRVSFDRAVEPGLVRDLAGRAVLEAGEYVRAGDRFESLRPGYAVVQDQLAAPRRRVPIYSARLEDEGHTLALSTAAHAWRGHYALTLPGLGRPAKADKPDLPQHAEVDLDYDPGGVEAEWRPAGAACWTGWLPHLDVAVARAFLVGSGAHRGLWENLAGAGELRLRTKLDLWQMLRPAVQPGSRLDHAWPDEEVTVVLTADHPFSVRSTRESHTEATREGKLFKLRLEHGPRKDQPLPLEVALRKGRGEAGLRVAFFTKEDPRHRPLPLRRFLLPWAAVGEVAQAAPRRLPELEGGHWLRGRRVFFSEEAGCGKCHSVRGEGGRIGPDLSNLVHRDYASVLKDIREPSAALNPDHISYVLELSDGRVLTGVPRDGGAGRLIVGDAEGREVVVPRGRVDAMSASTKSLMPEGIDRALGPEKMRDLMTFLLTEPLAPAAIECEGAPPPRSRAEVESARKATEAPAKAGKPLRVLLAAGPKDHGPGEHDYPLWQRRWYDLLSLADGVKVELATGWPSAAQLKNTDVVVFYSNNPGWSTERARQLEAFLSGGGGAVYLHYAVDGHRDVEALAERIGLAWRGGASRFRHGPLELDFTASKHPVARGLGKLKFVDESYWRLAGDEKRIDLIATGPEEGKPQPLLWARRHGKGRVFVSILGHYNWTFDDPLFRLVLLRGLCWSAGEPVDRLSELITVGARVAEK